MFVRVANNLIKCKSALLEKYDAMLDKMFCTDELVAERERLLVELNLAADRVNECIARNARVALNQVEYQQEYDRLVEQFEGIQARLDEIEREITETTVDRETIERFLRELSSMDVFGEFDESAWFALVDHMTVYSKEDVRVTFKDGSEIKA